MGKIKKRKIKSMILHSFHQMFFEALWLSFSFPNTVILFYLFFLFSGTLEGVKGCVYSYLHFMHLLVYLKLCYN